MLRDQIRQIVKMNPGWASITPVIEKEILHHDIFSVMVEYGVMDRLTFIGGTSLRLCYKSSRLSEDLDFNAGYDFNPSSFAGLEVEIQEFLQAKYEMDVRVNQPSQLKQGDTVSWTVSIERVPSRPDIQRQKIHIDVCAIPSFDIERRPLLNHYQLDVPTSGLLVPVQSLSEALVDKVVAFAYRARRIKPRDVWDLIWIQQRGIELSQPILENKLRARGLDRDDFKQCLVAQCKQLLLGDQVRLDFQAEMSRFIPRHIQERTIDTPEYWPYIQTTIQELVDQICAEM
jgi:predicted nucleotidyltransferase component of viral defense system